MKTLAPAWLSEIRATALSDFKKVGLPTEKNEDWKFTDLSALQAEKFDPAEKKYDESAVRTLLDALPAASNRIVFINGFFSSKHSQLDQVSVMVAPLSASFGKKLTKRLHSTPQSQAQAFSLLNTAHFNDGALVTIPKKVKAPSFELVYIGSVTNSQTQAVRNSILLEDGARATVIERFIGDGRYLFNALTDVTLGQAAHLSHYVFQEQPTSAFHIGHTRARLAASARLESFVFSSGGRLARNEASVSFTGEKASVALSGLYLARGAQHVDCHLDVRHSLPGCTTSQQYRGILQDTAHGVFNGKIYVEPGADKTTAIQNNKTILTSESAQINTKPQLEIFAEDVQCTHGATIGQLDEAALFYARTRGLEEKEARQVVLQGFLNETLEEIHDPITRAQVETRAHQWLSK
jgi:Fe-S cluster assembly protein SufD